jgi:hypothetical protein
MVMRDEFYVLLVICTAGGMLGAFIGAMLDHETFCKVMAGVVALCMILGALLVLSLI